MKWNKLSYKNIKMGHQLLSLTWTILLKKNVFVEISPNFNFVDSFNDKALFWFSPKTNTESKNGSNFWADTKTKQNQQIQVLWSTLFLSKYSMYFDVRCVKYSPIFKWRHRIIRCIFNIHKCKKLLCQFSKLNNVLVLAKKIGTRILVPDTRTRFQLQTTPNKFGELSWKMCVWSFHY